MSTPSSSYWEVAPTSSACLCSDPTKLHTERCSSGSKSTGLLISFLKHSLVTWWSGEALGPGGARWRAGSRCLRHHENGKGIKCPRSLLSLRLRAAGRIIPPPLFLSTSEARGFYLFQACYHSQDLIKDLHSELSGDFRKMVMATLKTPAEFDAYELNSAIKVNAQFHCSFSFATWQTWFLRKQLHGAQLLTECSVNTRRDPGAVQPAAGVSLPGSRCSSLPVAGSRNRWGLFDRDPVFALKRRDQGDKSYLQARCVASGGWVGVGVG